MAKNYKELALLHKRYADCGLRILAFPSNQFASQEPGSNAEIKAFALSKGAKYDLFSKINVNPHTKTKPGQHPLYVYLTSLPLISHWVGKKTAGEIFWNYTKFLVDKDGVPKSRYGPRTSPLEAEKDIRTLLGCRDRPCKC